MDTSSKQKIKTPEELQLIVKQIKSQGKKVVLCHGVFDLLHPGHIRHIESAKRHGDVLIVSLTSDHYVNRGPGRPVFGHKLRSEVLAALEPVDHVVINHAWTAVNILKTLKPDIYAKGSDYADQSKDVTGKIGEEEAAVKEGGGKIIFTDEITYSSSNLINAFFSIYSDEASEYLKEFRQRINGDDIKNFLDSTAKCRTLVIGDAIIDEYHYCSAMGKTPKENVISTRYISEEMFAGGSLAAANHVASICNTVDLITCLGEKNSLEEFVRSKLKSNIKPRFFLRKNAPTIVKRRFVEPAYIRKLFEISFINDVAPLNEIEDQIYDHLEQVLPLYDLVLITDFGHGMMTRRLINLIAHKARFLAVNTQTNSANMGYNLITKYPRASYICIDEPEARLALQDKKLPLDKVAQQLSRTLDAGHVIITNGNQGCVLFARDDKIYKIPALTSDVKDTVGAGDAFLSISAPCVASGVPMEVSGFLGNAAGAMFVGVVGNRTSTDKAQLLKFTTTLLK